MISAQQLAKELEAINARREVEHRDPVVWRTVGNAAGPIGPPNPLKTTFDTIGLALSGGGIRSAATCLGSIQALQASGKLKNVDYLSTVSGGGYLGCCLAANLSGNGNFPFSNETNDCNDLQDSAAVKYLRDHTNYLMPAGFADFLASVGVILRGLTASASLTLGPIFLLAGLTAYLFRIDDPIESWFGIGGNFKLTLTAATLFLLYLLALAMYRSVLNSEGKSPYEFRDLTSTLTVSGIWIVGILFVIELQPLAIHAIWVKEGGYTGSIVVAVTSLSKILAPFAGLVAAFAGWFVEVAKANDQQQTKLSVVRSITSRAALWIAALVLPLLLWQLYLSLASAAIPNGASYEHAFNWIAPFGDDIALLYIVVGVVLFATSWVLEPNANSLHRLYRDRLGDAFLFLAPIGNDENVNSVDRMKLSALEVGLTPYLLVNTALNIQRSEYANKRARDADFFMFSRDYIGSRATGYVPTQTMETAIPTLDLATVMAVSGAAASSNMGASALKPLAFTLALLNIRLGYWMPNPSLFKDVRVGFAGNEVAKQNWRKYLRSIFYLWSEMLSTLDETNDAVYLTDGGHIENLGVYELLRRRCGLIIVVDAEADPALRFPSFMALQRYARLDLGVRIELPWQEIRARYTTFNNGLSNSEKTGELNARSHGCHAAVGTIVYPDAPPGKIIYLKSTLTGDENDIVLNYKRKYPAFPHETTTDQFFAEEQFEAYRALGFHAMIQFLEGDDIVAGLNGKRIRSKVERARAVARLFR
jgi:hypothetical protein